MTFRDATESFGFTGIVEFLEVFGLLLELVKVRPGRQWLLHHELPFIDAWSPHFQAERRFVPSLFSSGGLGPFRGLDAPFAQVSFYPAASKNPAQNSHRTDFHIEFSAQFFYGALKGDFELLWEEIVRGRGSCRPQLFFV